MKHNQTIRSVRLAYLLVSAGVCLLGLVLIAVPEFSARVLCRLCGGCLTLFGIVKLFGYCAQDLYRLAFQYDLAFGILLLILGYLLLFHTVPVLGLVCALVGLLVLLDALLKIQIAIDAHRFGLGRWWLILAAAVPSGILGFVLLFRPSENIRVLTVLLGASLVAEGALNLITVLTAVRRTREIFPEVPDNPL